MITLKVEKGIIYLYDSIDNLPNSRKLLAERSALWEENVGTSYESIQNNLAHAKNELLTDGEKVSVNNFIENASIALYALQQGEDFKIKEFSSYIHSYQLTEQELVVLGELHDDKLEDVCKIVNDMGITIGQMTENLDIIKKKSVES